MTSSKQKYPTIRISAKTHEVVKQIAEENETSMAEVVELAIERLRRERIMQHANQVWAEAMKDSETRAYWKNEDRDIEITFWSPIDEPWEEEDSECPKKDD